MSSGEAELSRERNASGGERQALAGRVAVVTGASRGIGLAIARMLAAAGARVAMLARTKEELETRASALGATAFPCDIGDAEALDRVLSRIRADLGDPSLLVNNAGAFHVGALAETSNEQFDSIVRTNLSAPFALARAVAPAMSRAGAGDIVTIGSIADRNVFPGNAAYAAAKHGLRAMHEVLRLELRGTGVRATLVSPGPVDTPIWDPIDPDNRAGFTPRAAMLRPEAVADAVLWCVTRPPDVDIEELRLSRS